MSLSFYTIFMSHADDLQGVSVDEALIDVTTTVNELRYQVRDDDTTAKDFAEMIRAQVQQATSSKVNFFY